ncbi:MAG TPA: PilZ domain-containing protein [Nitrospiraceae bacterium]|nr:PilZ domain-containing protein [Nitrospiraceae bacterium]
MAEFVMRKHQRLKRLVPVRYRGDGIVGEGIIQDLSLSGSYLTGNAPVSVGIALALELLVPGHSESLLIDRVTVKWVKGSEFGVNFDTLQLKVVERITTLIATLVQTQHDSVHEREETWAGIRSGAQ